MLSRQSTSPISMRSRDRVTTLASSWACVGAFRISTSGPTTALPRAKRFAAGSMKIAARSCSAAKSQATSTVALSFVDEPRLVLSLDFRESVFQGPADLLEPSHWPRRVIAITLARVGGEAGPDFERLAELRRIRAPPASPCGGRRCADDRNMLRLAEMGIKGALVASALHDSLVQARSPNSAADGGGRRAPRFVARRRSMRRCEFTPIGWLIR